MSDASAYTPRRQASARFVALRGLSMHLHAWGQPADATPQRPLRVLMHGWMDVGASFQFVVDAMAFDGPVVAPDLRGFGRSAASGADAYWFPDYLGDLDALLDALSPDAPVDLVGHSMGGNVVMSYAGVRPQRIRRLVNLEGFGLPEMPADESPERLARWLDELKTPQHFKPYATLDAVAARLRANHPRLGPERAAWLAPHWARQGDDGHWHVQGDPAHKRVNPILYRPEEVLAAWRRISAPTLWVEGADTDIAKWWDGRYPRSDFEARIAQVPTLRRERLADCGHMLHFDQAEALAALLDDFFG
jgi:pimeloyl-ACP methyl ester carboxylesterase